MDWSPPLLLVVVALALGLAGLAIAVAIAMLRQRDRVLQQANVLTQDVEKLNDRLWELADSEERYRSLIEAQGDLIVRRDEGRIVYANPAYAALIGLAEAQIVGSRAVPAILSCRPAQALEDGTRVVDECIASPDGERWISWVETAVPVALGKTVLQRVGRDISARIAGEQALVEARSRAESASDAKSRFLATVSHEFRTPLNGILGMADLLNDTRLDPEQATYVRALKTSGEALLGLVDDILDFAKVEAGKLELAAEPFDPALLIETVSELVAPRAQAKGLEIACFVAPDLPARLVGDRDRLRQVLLNLVGNAVKFTQSGGVGLHVARSGEMLTITVSDTGPGIAPERQQAIFEEFEQADQSAARRHDGTGLGLAIVRRLVTLMGGTVAVASAPGAGASFRLVLPLPAAGDDHAPAVPDWRRRSVLIVSAAPFGADYLAQTVALTGAKAVCAVDAAAAQTLLAQTLPAQGLRFDAMLVDHTLGAEAARLLAAEAKGAGVADCLIVLSPGERRSFGSPLAAGFTGFLVKPVRARSLYERLSPPPQRLADQVSVGIAERVAPAAPRLTVLVAEDNEINALLATRTLERLGCAALWARNGREALALAEAGLTRKGQAFDLVLLDIRMPELDGLSVARGIRALEAALGRTPAVPILAVSANVAASDRSAALAAGMDDCLAKPLARPALQGWIDRIAARSEPALVG